MPQFANYTDTLNAQKKKAFELFGVTDISLPGTLPESGRFYPNMSRAFIVELLPFWLAELARAKDTMNTVIPNSATLQQWLRAETTFRAFEKRIRGLIPTKDLIPAKLAQVTWDILDALVLPMQGVVETTSTWDFIVEAVKETIDERLKDIKKGLGLFAKIGLAIGGIFVGYKIFFEPKDRQ